VLCLPAELLPACPPVANLDCPYTKFDCCQLIKSDRAADLKQSM
jgi:hypothetical protein